MLAFIPFFGCPPFLPALLPINTHAHTIRTSCCLTAEHCSKRLLCVLAACVPPPLPSTSCLHRSLFLGHFLPASYTSAWPWGSFDFTHLFCVPPTPSSSLFCVPACLQSPTRMPYLMLFVHHSSRVYVFTSRSHTGS